MTQPTASWIGRLARRIVRRGPDPRPMTDPLPRAPDGLALPPAVLDRLALSFQHLQRGRRYRVTVSFTDHDGVLHPVDEAWTFLGSSFLPYEDGLSLFVSPDAERARHIRLQWRPEAEGAVIDALAAHIVLDGF